MCRYAIHCVDNHRLNEVFYTMSEALEMALHWCYKYGSPVEISLWQIGGWKAIGLINRVVAEELPS